MNESRYLKDFLAFVAEPQEWKPRFDFMARCARMVEAPTFAYTLPRGVVMADPEWLVFLSLSTEMPGAKLMLAEYLQTVVFQYDTAKKLSEWVGNPGSLVKDVTKWFSNVPKNEDHFAQALLNPNSAFLPFRDIIGVEFKKGIVALRPHHIQLILRDGGFVIYQDGATENAFKNLLGQFSGLWQPEFLECLSQVARGNRT
jgi:hypothetical protein